MKKKYPSWVRLPNSEEIKSHILAQLSMYWNGANAAEKVSKLPIKSKENSFKISLPLKLKSIKLPSWANNIGTNGEILVPMEIVSENNWEEVDWWLAVFLMLECSHERLWESKYGSIHSYSWKLRGWDKRAWEHPWVNYIGLFLIKWVHILEKKEFDSLTIPKLKLRMTHDLDAVKKTLPIRIKQTALHFYRGRIKEGIKFFFKRDNWDTLFFIINKEKVLRIKPLIHIHAKSRIRSPISWLLDPSYSLANKKLLNNLEYAKSCGWELGLHPGFNNWSSKKKMLKEKQLLESALGTQVTSVRQHWLKFSWETTWNCQFYAGLIKDSTLMFNDRYGFRNASAIQFNSFYSPTEHKTKCCILMDSHKVLNSEIKDMFQEVKITGGVADILFHPHTITNSYGFFSMWDLCISLLMEHKC